MLLQDAMSTLHLVRRSHSHNPSAMNASAECMALLKDLRGFEDEMHSCIHFGADDQGVTFTKEAGDSLLADGVAAISDLNEKVEVLKTYSRMAASSAGAAPTSGWQSRRRRRQ